MKIKIASTIVSFWFRFGGCPFVVRWHKVKFKLRKQHYQLRSILGFGPEPFLKNLLLLASREAVFLDVGANIGIATLLMSKKVRQVVAFEPTPSSFEDLRFNVHLNKASNVHCLPAALSSSTGVMPMRAEPWWGHNAIIANQGQSLGKSISYVPVLELDSLLDLLDNKISGFDSHQLFLIKVDVEGHELDVLKGGRQLLSRLCNVVICFESWAEEYSRPCIEYLESLSYEIFSPPVDTQGQDIFMRKKS